MDNKVIHIINKNTWVIVLPAQAHSNVGRKEVIRPDNVLCHIISCRNLFI